MNKFAFAALLVALLGGCASAPPPEPKTPPAPAAPKDSVPACQLCAAVEAGDRNATARLLESYAPVDAADKYGWTALMIAAWRGDLDVIRLLLDGGANINAAHRDGWTALTVAEKNGRDEAAALLLAKGAEWGETPLLRAAWAGRTAAVEAILRLGKNPDDADSNGWTPLIVAARHGHDGAVRTLLDGGADPGLANGFGETALMWSARTQQTPEITEMLLVAGADVNAVSADGWTALDIANNYGSLPVIEALRGAGATQNPIGQ